MTHRVLFLFGSILHCCQQVPSSTTLPWKRMQRSPHLIAALCAPAFRSSYLGETSSFAYPTLCFQKRVKKAHPVLPFFRFLAARPTRPSFLCFQLSRSGIQVSEGPWFRRHRELMPIVTARPNSLISLHYVHYIHQPFINLRCP